MRRGSFGLQATRAFSRGRGLRPISAVGKLKRIVPSGIRKRVTPPLGHLRHQYAPRPLKVPGSYPGTEAPASAPKISVVIPTLNYGLYLGATLGSLFNQGYPDLEVRIEDGGSDDETTGILEAASERISSVEVCQKSTQAEAINRGLENCDGEIMAWLNADDLLLPGALNAIASFFARNPDVDVVYGDRVLINEAGEDVGLWVTPPHTLDSLQWFDFLPQETVFWRRSIWERVGGLDTSLEYGFDWDLFLRFEAAGGRFARLPRFIGAFRQHEDQKTRRFHEAAQEELAAIRTRRHGRTVGLDEAQARAEPVLVRSAPHYLQARIAWRLGGRVEVDAAPLTPDSVPARVFASPAEHATNGHPAGSDEVQAPSDSRSVG